jgi:uncharacterized protein YggE
MKLRTVLVATLFAALFGANAVSAQTADPQAERLLVLPGKGIARGAPDMALITLGVVSEHETARGALAENNQSMQRILDALKASGMESRDLQTSGFAIDPVYSQPPSDGSAEPFRPEIVGYRVNNNLTLRIRNLPGLGAVLDQVVTLGANSISGPTFTVEDRSKLEDEAREAAVKDALRKAELYATAAGITLGPVFRIEEGYLTPPQPLMEGAMMRMDAAAPASVPIESGELTFEVQVTVSWRIAG